MSFDPSAGPRPTGADPSLPRRIGSERFCGQDPPGHVRQPWIRRDDAGHVRAAVPGDMNIQPGLGPQGGFHPQPVARQALDQRRDLCRLAVQQQRVAVGKHKEIRQPLASVPSAAQPRRHGRAGASISLETDLVGTRRVIASTTMSLFRVTGSVEPFGIVNADGPSRKSMALPSRFNAVRRISAWPDKVPSLRTPDKRRPRYAPANPDCAQPVQGSVPRAMVVRHELSGRAVGDRSTIDRRIGRQHREPHRA